jgi:hypothetical protein
MSNNDLTIFKIQKAFAGLYGDFDTRQTALAEIRQSPETALQVLAENSGNLPMSVRARAFDDIIGEVSNPAKAQAMVTANFTQAQTTELLAARGGLPSAAVFALSREQVVSAMLLDMTNDGVTGDVSVVYMAVTVLQWVEMLKERKDWPQILEMDVGSADLTVMDLVLLGFWHQKDHQLRGHREHVVFDRDEGEETTTDELREQIPEAELLLLGIDDTDAAYDRLVELLREYDFSPMAVQAMGLLANQRREARMIADTVAAATANAADKVKVNVDF